MDAVPALTVTRDETRDDSELVTPGEPVCEVLRHCAGTRAEGGYHDPHDYDCDQPAAWVASFNCEHGHRYQFLACTECHDDLVAAGQVETVHGEALQVDWRPL